MTHGASVRLGCQMKPSSVERALLDLASMQKGRPYSLRPDDGKRRLADDLARICKGLRVKPVIIGGLAVNHHGYMRLTADVDILVSRDDAVPLYRRLKSETGWKRYAEGFMNTALNVGVDVCVEGEKTSPRSAEVFPSPADLRTVAVSPLPVPALSELVALKVMSGRVRDDADVVELLKRRPSRMKVVTVAAAKRLRTEEARGRLRGLLVRAEEELARRR